MAQNAARELAEAPRGGRNSEKYQIPHEFLKVFGFLRFSAERATQKASEGSETAPEGTKEWPKELQRAPRGSENCSGGFPERS